MCGRYGFTPTKNIAQRFKLKNQLKFEENKNCAPGSMLPVIINNAGNEAVLMCWGLIPSWARDPKIGYKMINARADTILSKPSFRKPFLSQRCLIPASGFYEWQQVDNKKIPFYFHLKDQELFAFAGLYDIWKDAEGYPLKTFTIITTEPNETVAPVHDRMPVILPEKSEDLWLDYSLSDPQKLTSLLVPYQSSDMISEKLVKINPDTQTKLSLY